jgi:integrase
VGAPQHAALARETALVIDRGLSGNHLVSIRYVIADHFVLQSTRPNRGACPREEYRIWNLPAERLFLLSDLLAGYPPPTAEAVLTTFAGIRRAHRRPLNKKTALVLERLLPAIRAISETLPGLRDRALLLVGFAAALRPSEIAGLTLGHATRHADGIELFLPWRKNDQDARGTKLWLPKGRTDLCPVKALEAWLDAAEITEGPLFRRIWRLPPPRVPRGAKRKPVADRYRIGTNPIDTDSIALIVKNCTGLAGFDAAAFAGHSLRRGAISSGVAQGSTSPASSSSPATPHSKASRNMSSSANCGTIIR